ncbi:MAG: 3-deoxy-7-phosphoheptulonate synthase [Polyangiaceae bacterium]|nr:3-deoxy-7-phosphoheptulonate synthase [Polyangiaceae bacterium]
MSPRVENTNVLAFQELSAPTELKRSLPRTGRIEELVATTRAEIRDVLRGVDRRRLVVVVGPCSIHNRQVALEYAERLAQLRTAHADSLIILMRTYFEKPRTTVGWKGLLNDPLLDGTCDIALGLRTAREILLEINRIGIPCASEALDPVTPQYVGDLLSWASIGARTTESQTHREMASGLSTPIGFKNGTDGSIEAAINALVTAGQPHSFLGINADGHPSVVKTAGNPDRHVVLRGGSRPNYYREDVEAATRRVRSVAPELLRAVMVDSSHGNSSKDFRRQGIVCRDVVEQFVGGQDAILGLLVESNLREGRQDWLPGAALEHGVSITDACIGWEETAALLRHLADRVRTVRRAA